MLHSTEKLIAAGLENKVFTENDIMRVFDGTPAKRYALIHKALKKNELIQLKRGVYILSLKYQSKQLSQFSIACHMIPHSYISFESALSYHGWIPERVALTSSVIHKGRTKTFNTQMGAFSYVYIPTQNYEFLSGVLRDSVNEQPFLIAKPLRALADLVYIRKYDWQGIRFLIESLRIEIENLMSLSNEDFIQVQYVYRSKRVNDFINQLRNVISP